MKIRFLGADKEVTGSCHCVEVGDKRLLIDCGLQQGFDLKNNQSLPFSARSVNHVFVTHAHIDHSGRLPLLVKEGFNGRIYATKATCDLLCIMLRDSGHIQEAEAKWRKRKGQRSGVTPTEPLYTVADAERTLDFLEPCDYDEVVWVDENVKAVFSDAGHLLGSASIQLSLTEDGVSRNVVFSGDIGNLEQPIIKDPQYLTSTDYLIMESTYGDRNHEPIGDYAATLAEIIDRTMARGGNVIIPSFAVGRTQELLYYMREIKERGIVGSRPDFEVYLDSPLALEATRIFSEKLLEYADSETLELVARGVNPLKFPGLKLCPTTEESRALNEKPEPKVIISSSGMCEAGRIRHHLKHNLWRHENTILFVGFQARGTLGRILLDGAQKVKLFGEEVVVRASIEKFDGLSAHADQEGLLKWVGSFSDHPKKVFVVHGEREVCEEFTGILRGSALDAVAPNFQAEFDLLNDFFLSEGVDIAYAQKKESREKPGASVYRRLVLAGERLNEIIRKNEGGANRDLGKFADQILALAEKWER